MTLERKGDNNRGEISKQASLFETYRQLGEIERSLVQVFAIIYEPTNRENARLCWNGAIAKNNQHLSILKSIPFKKVVETLLSQGLVVQRMASGLQCNLSIIELVVRHSVLEGTFEAIAQVVGLLLPIRRRYPDGPLYFKQESEFIRELRIAIYREDSREISALFEDLRNTPWNSASKVTLSAVLGNMLANPFEVSWMNRLPKDFFELGLGTVLQDSLKRGTSLQAAFNLLAEAYQENPISDDLRLIYAEQLCIRGRLTESEHVLDNITPRQSNREKYELLLGANAFLSGHTLQALTHFRQSLKMTGRAKYAQVAWFEQPAAVLFLFALLKDHSPTSQQEIEQYYSFLRHYPNHPLAISITLLYQVSIMQLGRKPADVEQYVAQPFSAANLPNLLSIYCLHWLSVSAIAGKFAAELPALFEQSLKASYQWIALEFADLMLSYKIEAVHAQSVEILRQQIQTVPLLDTIERKAAWELSLNALANLSPKATTTAAQIAPTSFRLAWRLQFVATDFWSLTPIEQKTNAKGTWTRGKVVALKRLATDSLDYLSDQDKDICDALETFYEDDYYNENSRPQYAFSQKALLALIGHPLVFSEDAPDIRIVVEAAEPELWVKKIEGDMLQLQLSPPLNNHNILAFQETPTRLKVIEITPQHRQIADIIGKDNQLELPATAKEKVLKTIASVANLVTVQSDIGGGEAIEEVVANDIPHVHLLPAGSGLKVSLLFRPFGEGGAYYQPGRGGETIIAKIGDRRLQTKRDLAAESANAEVIVEACTTLQEYEPDGGEWIIEEASDCLELLLQLQGLEDPVQVEWPEGEKFKISRQLGMSDFKFNIHRQKDWFAASGELQVSEGHILNLQQLMNLANSDAGQFIPLADGEFIALTDEFRRRLNSMTRLSQSHGSELRIHGLAALAINDILDNVEQLEVDQAWQDHIQRIQDACSIEPELPGNLQADLRDYQVEGYEWLARLANWGVGACLADDMGLGKTVQALAVILNRSQQGPALVIAPTSVGMNWMSEAERFTPNLTVKNFREVERGDRVKLITSLKAGDLLVCSYGIMQQKDVADRLAQVNWQTVVLDEAQAIKNYATKRSRAVMRLQSSFKIIMTGTPIENHLGELWNLFHFINPGLLGSIDSFNQRFGNPIERERDEGAKDALRRLIQPFILRRTKDQVLTELPSRTEITLPVELSPQEMAFYEALRREAIDKLSGKKEVPKGQKHLQVLAEIMRLRRACCNPSLVKPELAIPSAKLQQFSELLSELLDNGHKALVFSQFVDHLSILRKHLEKEQIAYQYLDGSTPAKKRKQNVDAFQNGEGDVFLISLKAGGTGLNLTAADYVIHMDPWWNPAVEDQASDRAYRIGQQRPVTIYRLVAKSTIEDKIVALHKTKRDLADSLLAGSDVSSKVSTEQLLALIQQ
ncbi:MAG: DEAD/DEAH box helicase [Cyanobacteria bacterium P01_D01_bin.105]